jgi:hypothetical protein
MVRAILDGRKTQTRRVLMPQPPAECGIHYMLGDESWLAPEDRKPLRHHWEAWGGPLYEGRPEGHLCGSHTVKSPYGAPGDRLWVREAWRTTGDGGRCDDMPPRDLQPHQVWYEADGPAPADECVGKYRPAMFMPRWASRLTLEVTGVRVERLQEIDWEDAIAEGIRDPRRAAWRVDPVEGCVAKYRELWDSLNAAREPKHIGRRRKKGKLVDRPMPEPGPYAWDANPWVWVVEFRRLPDQ